MSTMLRRWLSPLTAVVTLSLAVSPLVGAAVAAAPTVSPAVARTVVGKYHITVRITQASHIHLRGGRTRGQDFSIGSHCGAGGCELAWLFGTRAVGLISHRGGAFHLTIRDRAHCTSGRATVDAFHVTFRVSRGAIKGTESLVNTACGVRSSERVAFRGHRTG